MMQVLLISCVHTAEKVFTLLSRKFSQEEVEEEEKEEEASETTSIRSFLC